MSDTEELTTPVAVRFPSAMKEKVLAEVTRLHLRRVSDVIRIAVAEYFENHKKEIEGEKK